jgi:uncharacterized protein (TIGR00369 family)
VRIEPGRAVFSGTPSEFHYNPIGAVHGGFAATLLDSALGCAVHTTLKAGFAYTTIELKVNYGRPLRMTAGVVSCEGQVIHVGSRTDCGIWTTNANLQTGWFTLTLPAAISSAAGTLLAPSSYGQTLFACLGGGTRVYRSLNLGQTWDAGVNVGGTCTGLAVARIAGELQPSTSVVIHTTSAPVIPTGPPLTPGINPLEVTVVNHNSSIQLSLGFANIATSGSGRAGVWTAKRTVRGGASGPGVSYDVFAADGLQFYRYLGNNQWSGAFPVHVDTWWMEFPNTYDGGTGNCPAFAANDGGVVVNMNNSCTFNSWGAASFGLHVEWGNQISGLSATNAGISPNLCAASQGGQPCPLLYLPTTDDDTFIREPVNCQDPLL